MSKQNDRVKKNNATERSRKENRQRSKWGNFIGLFILWCGSALFCGLKHSFSAWFLFYSLGFILIYCISVPLLCLRRVNVSKHLSANSLFAGGDATISVQLNQHSWLPLPWLQVRESWINETQEITLVVDKLLFPWFQSRLDYHYSLRNVQRGNYLMHSLELFTGDVFGFMPLHRRIVVRQEFIVFPLPFDSGENMRTQRIANGTQSLHGLIRDYANGDPLNRIHWKSTARTGSLKTRETESNQITPKILFLDAGKSTSMADEAANFEFRIQLAAGWMHNNQAQSFPIGLSSIIDKQAILIPLAKPFDCFKGYQLLANLKPVEPSSFAELLSLQAVKLARDVTIVCITSNLCDSLVQTLKALRVQNRSVQLMVVGTERNFPPQCREWTSYLTGIGCEVMEFRGHPTNGEVNTYVDHATA